MRFFFRKLLDHPAFFITLEKIKVGEEGVERPSFKRLEQQLTGPLGVEFELPPRPDPRRQVNFF